MELLTNNNHRLRVLSLGAPEAENGSDTIKCIDDKGKRHDIKIADVIKFYGSIALPPIDKKQNNEQKD